MKSINNKLRSTWLVLSLITCQLAHAQYLGGSGHGCAVSTIGVPTAVALGNYFTGTTADFTLASNWSSGLFPSNETVTIRNSGTQPILTGAQTIAAGTTINILSGASLTVAPGGTLTVNGKLANNGTFTLKSDATGTASIGNSAGTITGNVTVERFIPAARKFRLMSHPFSSAQNLSIITDDIDITGNTTGVTDNTAKTLGTGFTATTGGLVVNNPSAFRFSTANANGNASDGGWKAFTAADGTGANNTWGVGQGIRVLIRGAKGQGLDGVAYSPSNVTLDMTGAVNIGNVNLSLVTGGTGGTAGFNLVGNPYPSPVDISAVVFASTGVAGINKTVYTRNPQTGAYTTQLLVNATPYNIPSYAAVFIQNTGAGSVTLPFTEARKASSSSLTTFKTGLTNIALFEFKIGGVVYDNLNIGFDENANAVFETKYDAIKLNNDSFNFSSLTSNGEYVCTDIRPFINEGKIKLFTNIKSGSTEIEISASAFNLPNGKNLFFVDNFANKTIKVDEKFKYNFLIDANNQSTFGAERFYLTTSISTSIKELSKESFCSIYPNPTTDKLNIALNSTKEGNYNYTVFNQLGQVILLGNLELKNGKPATINTQEINSGIYFIQVTNGSESQTIKFIK